MVGNYFCESSHHMSQFHRLRNKHTPISDTDKVHFRKKIDGLPECESLCMGLPLCWWLEPPGPPIKCELCECPWECDRAGCKGGLGNPGGLAELSGCETPLLPRSPG